MSLLEAAFGSVTHLGDYEVLLGFAALYALLVRPGDVRPFVVAAVAIALVTWLKALFAVPRPPTATIGGYSFPSGHATAGTATFVVVGLVEDRLTLAIGVALLVTASRVVIGVHRPVDVVVGFALGATLALASYGVMYQLPEWYRR